MSVVINNDSVVLLERCNRVEVIDPNGRVYSKISIGINVKVSLQDDSRTLKIFISEKMNDVMIKVELYKELVRKAGLYDVLNKAISECSEYENGGDVSTEE